MTTAPGSRRELSPVGPLAQLRGGRLARRLGQLLVGLVLYGVSMALVIRSGLGLFPWDVLHYGLARHWPLTFGQTVVVVSFVVLLAWLPLRQAPGLGTVLNALVIGLVVDRALTVLDRPPLLTGRIGLLVAGVLLNGLATALYIGSQLGPGPRDGLMTGLARRTGRSLRLVRTSLEVGVVVIGWLLGGVFGIGTVLYAVAIGPLVQLLLPPCIVVLREEAPRRPRK
ncbi:MAG: YczE/YyaS/YitT family protein [Nocardioidaceae bacterium]